MPVVVWKDGGKIYVSLRDMHGDAKLAGLDPQTALLLRDELTKILEPGLKGTFVIERCNCTEKHAMEFHYDSATRQNEARIAHQMFDIARRAPGITAVTMDSIEQRRIRSWERNGDG
jgi:hypothetical protein